MLRAGGPVRKASEPVRSGEALEVSGAPEPWVGRAAYKLLAALERFEPAGLGVAGRRCLDVGASTGGFTQVLLARDASEVTALDVGHRQLAPLIRDDPRVEDRPGTSVRDVTPVDLGGVFDLIVGDLSFISLRMVIGRLAGLLGPEGDVVLLVKPQFEVGREALGRTGVVRSTEKRADAVRGVLRSAQDHRLHPLGLLQSPVTGASGNHEYLLWLSPRSDGMMSAMDVTEALTQVS